MAHRYARRSLDLATEELGPQHPKTAVLSYNLAAVSFQLERYGDAIPLLEQTIRLNELNYGARCAQNIRPTRKLARAYRAMDRYPQAERTSVRAIELIERHRGRNEEEIADILYDLVAIATTQPTARTNVMAPQTQVARSAIASRCCRSSSFRMKPSPSPAPTATAVLVT